MRCPSCNEIITPAFPNRMEAMAHLRRLGYKIGKSKIYKDAAAGLLKMQSDGSVIETDLMRYAKISGLDRPAAKLSAKTEDLASQKLAAEVDKVKEQVEKLQLEKALFKGKYILSTDVDMAQAAQAAVISVSVDQLIAEIVSDVVQQTNGDTAALPAAIEAAKNKKKALFNRLAENVYEVEIRGTNDEVATD